MAQLRNIIIAIITSPELLAGLFLFASYVYFPNFFEFLGNQITSEAEKWKYLALLPSALTVWNVKLLKDIRSPSDKTLNKALYQWPKYPLLIGRLNLALAISIACSITSIGTWIGADKMAISLVGLAFSMALLIAGIVAIALTLASHKLVEILVKNE